MRRSTGIPTLCVGFMLWSGHLALGQDERPPTRPTAKASDREEREWLDRWKREAAAYRIEPTAQPGRPLKLRDEPTLRWTNPVRETGDGLVFLWLDGRRPSVIACFYRVRWQGRPTEAHEFHSLVADGLTATLGERTVWAPSRAGVQPKPIPGAPRPAASPAERLRQMRALAREFHATLDVDKGPTDLRLLAQPIYRYEGGNEADGALFAYVLTTDPEAILVIDERPDGDGPSWHYAFARMTDHTLKAKHRENIVWEAEAIPGDKGVNNPYTVRWDVGPRP